MAEHKRPEHKTLPEWRAARDRMSQWKLAQKAGISPSTLAYIEQGRSRPSFNTFMHLAEALEVAVEQIELPAYRPYIRPKREK